MAKDKHQDPPGPPAGPGIKRLTRRELLKWGILAGGVTAGAAVGGLAWLRAGQSPSLRVPRGYKKLDLSDRPNPNPAFSAQVLPDGGLVTWVYLDNDAIRAYALNPQGRLIWRLCDGRRTLEQICGEFAQRSGRPSEEARGFVNDLRRKGLIVQGGYIVASAGFPEAREPRRYLRRLADEEPEEESR